MEPGLDSNDVGHVLVRSAKDLGDPGRDDYYGWGRLDARGALDMVLAKRADLNGDWVVDEKDLAMLTAALDTNDLSADIAPATKRDGVLDEEDRDLLMRYLGTRIPPMPEPGLIAHWALDETEGQVAYSSVVIYEAVTPRAMVHGEPVWQPDGGKVGGALQFDGVDDCLTTQLIRDPSEGPFTVLAWVKGGAPGQVILSQEKGANWLVAAVPDGALATELKSTGRAGKVLKSTLSITDGTWHRVGLVWDGSNRALYVDGVEVARDTQTTLAGTYWGLHIGTGSTMAPTSFWKGLIDDVRVYNRAVQP